ncbi:MAG: hypothetical protein M3Y41_09390 [Pseudomonadota bacterium]|nr:hypothetical protein [Pseudomonadota bacterium]
MARVKQLTGDVLAGDTPIQAAPPAASLSPTPIQVPLQEKEKPRKFTMLNSTADDERARRLTNAVVQLAGIRVTKSMRADVVRALIVIAVDDPELQRRLAEALRNVP